MKEVIAVYNENQYENYESYNGENVVNSRVTYNFSLVFLWMFAAIFVTGLVAWLVSLSPLILITTLSWPFVIVTGIIQIVIAVVLGKNTLLRLNKTKAIILFFTYAILNGLTFGFIFYLVNAKDLFMIFAISAGYFGLMALFSAVFKNALRNGYKFFFIGLISLLIMSLVSLFFWYNNTLLLGISILGLIVFGGLTAFDIRWIRDLMNQSPNSVGVAIYGAFHLYLDFINVFVYFLRIFLLSNNRKN